MSEFADGNLAMISPPISGDFEYEGFFTADNFLGPLEGMTLDDLMTVLMSGDAYVSCPSRDCVGNVGIVLLNGQHCCAGGIAVIAVCHLEPPTLTHPLSTPAGQHPLRGVPGRPHPRPVRGRSLNPPQTF